MTIVLSALMNPPFESLASCSLFHLSRKVAFLMEIPSTRRVGEFGAFWQSLSTQSLILHPKFITKVPSEFHLNQTIHYPKPHMSRNEKNLQSLKVCRALSFYLHESPLRSLPDYLFPSLSKWKEKQSHCRHSVWISGCILLTMHNWTPSPTKVWGPTLPEHKLP